MTAVQNGVTTNHNQEGQPSYLLKYLLTHYYFHALNLAVEDTVKNVTLLKETLEDA